MNLDDVGITLYFPIMGCIFGSPIATVSQLYFSSVQEPLSELANLIKGNPTGVELCRVIHSLTTGFQSLCPVTPSPRFRDLELTG